jgi:hypothetical protein
MSTHGRELTDNERWAILRRYGLEVDPVIEADEKDVDHTLLRDNLRHDVAKRFQRLAAMQRLVTTLRHSTRKARS